MQVRMNVRWHAFKRSAGAASSFDVGGKRLPLTPRQGGLPGRGVRPRTGLNPGGTPVRAGMVTGPAGVAQRDVSPR
jgi:hypothetical protein